MTTRAPAVLITVLRNKQKRLFTTLQKLVTWPSYWALIGEKQRMLTNGWQCWLRSEFLQSSDHLAQQFPNTTTNANPVGKAKHVLSYIGLETRKLSLEEYELHHNVSFQNPSICSRLSPVRFAECIMEIVSCTSRADSFREPTFFRHIVLCGLRKVSGSCLWRLQATAA